MKPVIKIKAQREEHRLATAIKDFIADKPGVQAALNTLLAEVDPNIIRRHAFGIGNGLHQAIRYTQVRLDHHNDAALFQTFIAHGATLDLPCENKFDSDRQRYTSVLTWIGEDFEEYYTMNGQFIKNLLLPALLDAGADCAPLDARDDAIGQMIREHPSWRRRTLLSVAQDPQVQDQTQRKPKI